MFNWTFKRANPIVNYMVGFELDPPIPPHALKEIAALAPVFAADLPRKTEQQAFMFQIGPAAVPQSNIGGVTFDELDRDGTVKKQLAVSPQTIFYSLIPYQRWVEFWPLADRLLAQTAHIALRHSKISAFVLNAVNKFYWDGPEDNINFRNLIREDCQYVAANIRETKGLCHSFHGFVRPSELPARRIDNINFSVGERIENSNAAELVFNIRMILQDRNLAYENLFLGNSESFVASSFKTMHDSNNKLFAEVIVSEICEKIPGVPTV